MANGTQPPLSAAGMQLGLGSLLGQQTQDETDELRRRRQLMAGGPAADLAATGYGGRAALASPLGQYFGLGRV
jgi:hypothetical protein